MTRRQQLTETQLAALFDPPTGHREMVRHYALSAEDLVLVGRRRGDHSRLGHALVLCYLRHPGRPLRAGEQPPAALVAFAADQVGVPPEVLGDYLASEQNRRRHAAELQERLGLRVFGQRTAADLAGWLLPHAVEDDRPAHLAGLAWPDWSWRSAGGDGSSSRRRGRSNGCAWRSATGRGTRPTTG